MKICKHVVITSDIALNEPTAGTIILEASHKMVKLTGIRIRRGVEAFACVVPIVCRIWS